MASPRSKKQFTIKECGRNEWEKFRRYHYLNTDISSACKCYGLYSNDAIIAFMGILHQPHSKNRKIKRVSRLVVLPDYQGIGIGYAFLNKIAELYTNEGWTFTIVTSAKNLIWKLANSDEWFMKRLSVNKCASKKSAIDYKRKSIRNKNKTASFERKKG